MALLFFTDPSVTRMAWPSHMACAVTGRDVWWHVPRCMSCWSGNMVYVVGGGCMKVANPVVMNMPAWNCPEMGMHRMGKFSSCVFEGSGISLYCILVIHRFGLYYHHPIHRATLLVGQ